VKINLIAVCTGSYPAEYAIKLKTRFEQISSLDTTFYCITDKEDVLKEHYVCIHPTEISESWWDKMPVYSNEMPEGWNLYIDLDIVLIKCFDEEIKWAISQNKDITCISDAITWCGVEYNSSFLLLKSGTTQHIYDAWLESKDSLSDYVGGDQVWVGRYLKDTNTEVQYLDDTFDIRKNFKHHLCTAVEGQVNVPRNLPDSVKMVDCSGVPKPHQLEQIPYIKEFWHDIK